MEMGLFRVKETTRVLPDEHVTIDRTTKVTGRGQIYFVNRFFGRVMSFV
jgi:anti-repressor protein